MRLGDDLPRCNVTSLKPLIPLAYHTRGTSAALHGYEVCDCYRRDPLIVENRFTRIDGASVSFLTQVHSGWERRA